MPEYVRMDKYCSSVRDGTHDTPKPTEDGFYLVTSKAINNDAIDFSGCYYISAKDYNKINERSKVDKWDVIMTMIGTVGRLHLVQDDPSYAIKTLLCLRWEKKAEQNGCTIICQRQPSKTILSLLPRERASILLA